MSEVTGEKFDVACCLGCTALILVFLILLFEQFYGTVSHLIHAIKG